MKALPRRLTFERWRFAAKLEDAGRPAAKLHAVLPAVAKGGGGAAEAALAEDLELQGLAKEGAREVAVALRAEANKACATLVKMRQQVISGKQFEPPTVYIAFHRHSVDMRCGETFVKVGRIAYGKLSLLHRLHAVEGKADEAPPAASSAAGSTLDVGEAEEAEAAVAEGSCGGQGVEDDAASGPRGMLHLRIFTLLLRYKNLGGHGFQAALGPSVWTLLRERLGVGFECFASPLNAYMPQFCSGFEDVDAPFGSRGSFFGLKPLTGSFAANPPFVHPIMDAMADHLLNLLEIAKDKHALAFSVFVPGWREGKAFHRLSASPLLRRMVLVAAADHGYCDGASYQRKDPFRESPYDTACFFLQTDRAAQRWPVDDGFEAALRSAMAQCVPSAAAVKRQGLKRKRKRSEGT